MDTDSISPENMPLNHLPLPESRVRQTHEPQHQIVTGAVPMVTETSTKSISPPKVSDLFFMPMKTLLLNHVMEYTNPLLGLTSS